MDGSTFLARNNTNCWEMLPCRIGATFLMFGKKKNCQLNSLPSENTCLKNEGEIRTFSEQESRFLEVNHKKACSFSYETWMGLSTFICGHTILRAITRLYYFLSMIFF